jgi:hypothetical protein
MIGRKIDKNNTPLDSKQQYLDPVLTKIVTNSINAQPGTFDELDNALHEEIANTSYPNSNNFEIDPGTKIFETQSGVREVPYELLPPLKISPKFESYPGFKYLDFVLFTPFSNGKNLLDINGKYLFDIESKNFIDIDDMSESDPWKFPILKNKNLLNKSVHDSINAKNSIGDYSFSNCMFQVNMFIEVQRLFRLAFEGRLGINFPLQKLLEIPAITKGSVIAVITDDHLR